MLDDVAISDVHTVLFGKWYNVKTREEINFYSALFQHLYVTNGNLSYHLGKAMIFPEKKNKLIFRTHFNLKDNTTIKVLDNGLIIIGGRYFPGIYTRQLTLPL